MPEQKPRILIIGYGNPGRQDDGLGPALAESLSDRSNDLSVVIQTNYQLVVEDALTMVDFDIVIFIDAMIKSEQPFCFYSVEPTEEPALGSHSISPSSALALCETLYGHRPQAYILGVLGYDFNRFEQRLTRLAEENMIAARSFLIRWLKKEAVTYA